MMGVVLGSSENPLNHVVQHPYVQWSLPAPDWMPGFLSNVTILSNHIVMQIVAALILLLLIPRFVRHAAASRDGTEVPRGWGNAIEGLCDALRTHVARPALGPYTDRFIPYIWSVFFFILTCNLLGLVPLADWTRPIVGGHGVGGTSTGNMFVTGTLAACSLIMIVGNGLRLQGMAYVSHFFMGPFPINLLIAFLEVVGLLAKTFALAVRLFANMVAGHVLLAVLLSFIGLAATALGSAGALAISIPVVLGSLAINMLEVFVAFLQAFIFTFLTTMFIGQAVNIHHEHKAHETEHGEEHSVQPATQGLPPH